MNIFGQFVKNRVLIEIICKRMDEKSIEVKTSSSEVLESLEVNTLRHKKVDYIKRPMNAFMIWSQRERKKIWSENKDLHNSQISKWLGKRWNQLSDEERQPFFDESKTIRNNHSILYPNYKYRPQKKLKTDSIDANEPKPRSRTTSRNKFFNKKKKNQNVLSKKVNPNLKFRITIDKQRIESKSVPNLIDLSEKVSNKSDDKQSLDPNISEKNKLNESTNQMMSNETKSLTLCKECLLVMSSKTTPEKSSEAIASIGPIDCLLTPSNSNSSSIASLTSYSNFIDSTNGSQFDLDLSQELLTPLISDNIPVIETIYSDYESHLEFPDFTPEFDQLLNEDLLDYNIEN